METICNEHGKKRLNDIIFSKDNFQSSLSLIVYTFYHKTDKLGRVTCTILKIYLTFYGLNLLILYAEEIPINKSISSLDLKQVGKMLAKIYFFYH